MVCGWYMDSDILPKAKVHGDHMRFSFPPRFATWSYQPSPSKAPAALARDRRVLLRPFIFESSPSKGSASDEAESMELKSRDTRL
jgi:hypothetical protein